MKGSSVIRLAGAIVMIRQALKGHTPKRRLMIVAGAAVLALALPYIVAGVIMLIVNLNYVARLDVVTEVYADAAGAQKMNAAARGMVPGFLPQSARQIVATCYCHGESVHRLLAEFGFSYSEDFLTFLATQQAAPVPKGLQIPRPGGSKLDIHRLDSLVYIQCVDTGGENGRKGSLIINTMWNRALFVSPALDPKACPAAPRSARPLDWFWFEETEGAGGRMRL
ncbi:MAG: hypothetical protein LBP52_07510 [Burkholderiaceae bacterium]|jgi:hypothetical protein|nr:hypothetical protein [Burkholderiaceae bacterium]